LQLSVKMDSKKMVGRPSKTCTGKKRSIKNRAAGAYTPAVCFMDDIMQKSYKP